MSVSSVAHFDNHDTFLYTMRFLNPKDFFHLERVCRSWEKAIIDLRVLEQLFEAENIPAIEGRRPNHKAYVVLSGMLDRGVSLEKIEKYYGKPVFGKMPRVSQQKYDLMFEPDPEDLTKKMFETYEAVFTPLAIKRTFGKDLAATVDEEGRLTIKEQDLESSSEEYELEIPFSFPNLVELSHHPLGEQDNWPVFSYVNERVLEQCCRQATKVGIYFMRTNILKKSRMQTWDEQKALTKSLNQEITPLIVRAFSNYIKILEDLEFSPRFASSYPDVRTSDSVKVYRGSCPVCLGDLVPSFGVNVTYCSKERHVGVAPVVSAEV
jgi:hypothetical protein